LLGSRFKVQGLRTPENGKTSSINSALSAYSIFNPEL
jgi:hypothetical protein